MINPESEQQRRILLIDDNRSVHADYRKVLMAGSQASSDLDADEAMLFGSSKTIISSVHFEVDSAYQGEEGADKVRQAQADGRPYAMAFVDMRMPPGWDGVVTTGKIWEIDPDIQIVICTAYSDYSWKDMLDAIGAGDRMVVLKKPFEPIEVLQLAKMLTEKWWLYQLARQKMEDLEKMVAIRTTDLQASNQKLVRRNEEIQYFYHSLSHELKTPLTSAREFVSIVAEGLAGDVNETQAEYLAIAHDNCSHLAIYINDLLDMTRLDTGKMGLSCEPVALSKLIGRVQTMMQAEASKKKIQLSAELDTRIQDMMVDKSRIMQVLVNLYNNALKFTPAGGSIIARLYRDPLRPDWVELSVTDTGCGIPEDQTEYLFRRYYQVNPADSRHAEGFGLGLYLCKALMKLHGGSIKVESSPGKGSTFTLSLPVTLMTSAPSLKAKRKSYVFGREKNDSHAPAEKGDSHTLLIN
jgi:signal transduction histidine kinase